MKVYKFYSKPTNSELMYSNDLELVDKYPLYAFTKDKRLRDIFKETRNMKRFIEVTSKMSDEDYLNYANTNGGQLLSEYEYEHNLGYNSGKMGTLADCYTMEDVKVVSTWMERESVQSARDEGISDLSDYISYRFFPFILEKKYIEALRTLEFISYWKLMNPVVEDYLDVIREEDDVGDFDYSAPSVQFDELNMFIALYGYTFKV